MSAASKKRGQRLWALFTNTPLLSDIEQWSALIEGRDMLPAEQRQPRAPEEAKGPGWDTSNPTPQHCAFAQQGHDHLTVYFIFASCTREQAERLRRAMVNGESTADWEWPLTHAPKLIQRLNWNDRQEAWRLLGGGGLP